MLKGEKLEDPMGFTEYLRKGVEMAKLRGEAAEEVAADENAFIPAMVMFALPMLLVEAGVLVFFSMGRMVLPFPGMTSKALAFLCAFNFLLVLMPFAGVGILHLVAKAFKGEGGYYGYYQAMGVGSIVGWGGIIPYIGIIFSIWSVVVNVVITKHVQKLTTGKAAAVVLMPVLVGFILGIFIAVFVGMGMFMGLIGRGMLH